MANVRLSQLQKSIILVLASGFTRGIKSIESPDLRSAVEAVTKSNVDRSNFQKSLKTLVSNGYVMRENIANEVWYNITPGGFDKAIELNT